MNNYDLNIGDYVSAYVCGYVYHGKVIGFSFGGDCVELEDVDGVSSHFYISDLNADPLGVLDVMCLMSIYKK